MIFSGIAAVAANGVIGKDGDLPWNLPEDMKFFRDKTAGKIMIMGRRTFESLPGGKPLPKRFHIVVTRQPGYTCDGVVVVSTIEAAFREAALKHEASRQTGQIAWGEEAFVIGGGDIFSLSMPKLNYLYLTEIKADVPGDAYFPKWNKAEFDEIERRPGGASDAAAAPGVSPLAFDFVVYKRKNGAAISALR